MGAPVKYFIKLNCPRKLVLQWISSISRSKQQRFPHTQRSSYRIEERPTNSSESLEGRLLFAVPKSQSAPLLQLSLSAPAYDFHPEGRLQQATLDLLAGSDIQFRRETRLDIALVKNHPIALVFLPAADIPTFVGEGRVDLGITGGDQVAEHESTTPSTETTGVEEVLDLGFGTCALKVQVPEKGTISDARDLVGKNVVTSFEGLTEKYFAKLEGQEIMNGEVPVRSKLKTKIKYVGGSVEAACALGVADGIVDLVGMALENPARWPVWANKIEQNQAKR